MNHKIITNIKLTALHAQLLSFKLLYIHFIIVEKFSKNLMIITFWTKDPLSDGNLLFFIYFS